MNKDCMIKSMQPQTKKKNSYLMNASAENLEIALLNTVDAEIKLMHSFNKKYLPVDLATTVAMRMSRAVVSSICQIGEKHTDTFTAATRVTLQRHANHLNELSANYEYRIRQSDDRDALLPIWQA